MIINERNHIASKLVVGIKDKTGKTNALSYSEVQETTNLLSDIASENVVPSILIKIDTIEVEDGNLVIATVKEGLNKPYHDNKGIVWVKNGADKRKVAKTEHSHPLGMVVSTHFRCGKGVKRGLKNGALPFTID